METRILNLLMEQLAAISKVNNDTVNDSVEVKFEKDVEKAVNL